jgi:hypothetical protein
MTKKGFIHFSCIILMLLVFFAFSCSQATMTKQEQPKNDVKAADANKAKIVSALFNTMRYYVIPTIMEEKAGWDWCASAAICMMTLEDTCGWVDQTKLYNRKGYSDIFPQYNFVNAVRSYKYFHGTANYCTYDNPQLSALAQYGFGNAYGNTVFNTIFISVRRYQNPKLQKFTVVLYGYNLLTNQVAYFNPHTGFCGWVNYSTFINGYYENGVYSSSEQIIGVDLTGIDKSWYPEP